MNAIEISNLEKNYDKFSLKIEELNIPEGYITGFIGPNGAGKTTTIKSILGMVKPTQGKISVLGADISKDIATKEKIAYVGGSSGYLEDSRLSRLHKLISRFYSNWDEELYIKYIEKFQVDESKIYKELSTGKKKQFDLIMALSHHPKVLIMDEPTANLDPIIRNEFLELIQEHMDLDEMTVFYSSHITSDLEKAADYIVMINNGRIILKGEKDEILEKHALVKIKKELGRSIEKNDFIAFTENSFGWEGLFYDKRKAFELFGNEAIYEKASLEDILLYYTRGSK